MPKKPFNSDKLNREHFINRYAPITLREGYHWIIPSPPYTNGFYFRANCPDSLRIGFEVGYYGFDATARRTESGWIVKNRKVSSVI